MIDKLLIVPAAYVLQCLGEIPMIQGDYRVDVCLYQGVDQIVVILHTVLANTSSQSPVWKDPCPGQRKAVKIHLVWIKQNYLLNTLWLFLVLMQYFAAAIEHAML